MNKDRLNEILSIILGILSVLAIIGLLIKNNFDSNELLGSIIDFTQVAIPVLVLLVTLTIKKESKSNSQIGKEALSKLQSENKDLLLGPRYNRDIEKYDLENSKALEYLFVTNEDLTSKLRAKFIPIQPLNEGILAIYVQKGTLVHGLKYSSEKATETEIKAIQSNIYNSISDLLKRKYSTYYDIIPVSKEDTAIIIDFDEEKLGKKKFSKAVSECTQLSISILKRFKNKH